jgi:hypothetical protein
MENGKNETEYFNEQIFKKYFFYNQNITKIEKNKEKRAKTKKV